VTPRDAVGTPSDKGWSELYRALGALVDAPRPEHARLAELLELPGAPDAAEHTTLFELNLYPYASVHLGLEGMLGGEARDRVAGFWRALGLTPPAEPDHLGALLGLLAALEERADGADDPAQGALLGQARAALLREHLLPWLPAYLVRVEELAGPVFQAWGRLLAQALVAEDPQGTDGGDTLPVHLRELPPLPDPREAEEGGGEGFLKALLAPARSGMILTRMDLARAGRALGLGVRLGERAYVLKAFLSQDSHATLTWLSGEARRQAGALDGAPFTEPTIAAFWRDRALAAADLLDELASAEAHHPWTTPEPRADHTTEAHHA